MRFKNKLLVICFLWFYCTISLFYDFRILAARQIIGSFDISNFFSIWAVCVLPFVAFFLLKIPNDRRLIGFYSLYAIYILISLLVGLTEKNDVVYTLGDLYKSFFILAGIGLFNYTQADTYNFYSLAFKILFFFAVLRLSLFLYLGVPPSKLYYGTVYDTFMVGFGLIYSTKLNSKNNGPSIKRRLTTIIPILLVLIGQKKLVLISILTLLVGQMRKTSIVVIGLLTISGLTYFLNDLLIFLSETRLRSLLNYQDLIYAEAQRLEEVKTSYKHWTEDWFTIIFGHGFGAELNVYSFKEKHIAPLHSIHNTTIVTAVRSGIFGLLLLLWIGGKSFLAFFSNRHNRSLSALLLAALVAAQFSYTFVDEVFVGYIFADIVLNKRRLDLKSMHA